MGQNFVRQNLKNYRDESIVRHHTIRKTPQQNGVTERMNRTPLERARCMLSNTDLGKEFWTEVVSTAYHLVNLSLASAINFKTSKIMWSDNPPDYSDFRVFGCLAYIHVNNDKLEPRAKKYIFLNYVKGVKRYKFQCPDPKSPKFMIERNITFDESTLLHPKKNVSIPQDAGSPDNITEQVEFKTVESHQRSFQQQHQLIQVPDS